MKTRTTFHTQGESPKMDFILKTDREWFAANPDRRYYARLSFPIEIELNLNSGMPKALPGYVYLTIVYLLIPETNSRIRTHGTAIFERWKTIESLTEQECEGMFKHLTDKVLK